MFLKRDKRDAVAKKRVKIHETTLENDMRYRGPLSYFHFQILGWLCIALSQAAVLLRLAGRVNPEVGASSMGAFYTIRSLGNFSLPFLLIAVFAQLLDSGGDYLRPIVKNAVAAAGVCVAFYIVYYRYFLGGIGAFLVNPGEVAPVLQTMIDRTVPNGFVAFNIFVDVFLCALALLFLTANPRRLSKGVPHVLFRLMALLPVAYEIACTILKYRSAKGLTEIPIWAFPLLTVKPPMTFVLFVALALFVKTRERRFRRHGKTHEEYRAFLKTRRNSWNFSVFLAIMLALVSVADFAAVMGFSAGEVMESAMMEVEASHSATPLPGDAPTTETAGAPAAAQTAAPDGDAATGNALSDEALYTAVDRGFSVAKAVGFGGSVHLILLAPLMLLFSYTRKPRNPWFSLLVPAAGVALVIVVYLEGFHRILFLLPFEKITLEELQNSFALYSTMLM